MADLDKIKRNVGRMVDQDAPVEHIDEYIKSEGVTLDQVRKHRPGAPQSRVGSFASQPPADGGGFMKQFIGNIPTGIAGTLEGLEIASPPHMMAAMGRKIVGAPSPKEQWEQSGYAPPKPVTSDERLGATIGDFVGGSAIPGLGWIGGARNMAAQSVIKPAESAIQRFVQRAAAETAAHPWKSAGFDLASAVTGGTAKHSAEEAGYGPGVQTLAALAGGMAPATPGILSNSPVGAATRWMTGRGQGARNALEDQMNTWQQAGVRDFGPAQVDNPVYQATARSGARSIVGGPLRRGAEASIDDTLSQARNVIRRGTDGQPINDVAEGLQTDLRQAFNGRRPVSNLPDEELDALAGPISPGQRGPLPQDQQGMKAAEAELSRLKTEFDQKAAQLGRKPDDVFSEIDAMAKTGDKSHPMHGDYAKMVKAHDDLVGRWTEADPANTVGFRVGRSREPYGTEVAAAYEKVGRMTPREPFNPMGGATPEGRAAKTSVKALMQEFADDAHSAFAIRGSGFDESGAMTGEFRNYLRGRFGATVADRIAAMSKAPPGHSGTMPEALRDLRTTIRREAEDAERHLLPGEVRRADAASLRRLHGALEDDIYNFTKRSGGPAERFQTETLPGQYVPRENELNRSTRIGDMRPSDNTIYVKPEHLDRLTGSTMPADHKGKLSAARMFEVDDYGIMVRNNATGQADRSTRVPYSLKPETGSRPVQIWDDGSVHYGSQIVSRDMSPGEVSADMMRSVNREYGRYVEELRKPLAKVFGAEVKPLDAMEHISSAVTSGDLRTIRALMRVMDEKSDPTKATSAIIASMTKNAATLDDFIKGMSQIHPDVRPVIFRGEQGRIMQRELAILQGIGKRLQSFNKATEGGLRINTTIGNTPDIANLTNLAFGFTAASNFFGAMVLAAGSAGMARFMASPRYLTWMTRGARVADEAQWQRHVVQLSKMLQHDDSITPDMRSSIMTAAKDAMSMRANAMTGGPRSESKDAHPYQGVFDAAKAKGVDYQNADPQAVMDAAWEASPTDAMGEMLDAMAKSLGVPPPWERKGR